MALAVVGAASIRYRPGLLVDRVEVTTGTADIYVSILDAGVTKYLQSDEVTFSATSHFFTVSYDATKKFGKDFAPVAAMSGYAVAFESIHSVYGRLAPKEVFVSTSDLANLATEAAATANVNSVNANVDAEHVATRAQMTTFQGAMQVEHDATQAQVAALQADFDAFEIVNQAEHDSTQSLIAQINGAANAILAGPHSLTVPSSGTKTYRFLFRLRDLDQVPVALIDPDSNRVTFTPTNASGATPPGITLSDSDGGVLGAQGTRTAQGEYYLDITVDPAADIDSQLVLEGKWARGGVVDFVILVVNLVDLDPQLARIEAQVNALRATDVPAIQTNIDQEGTDTRALVQSETDAIDSDLSLIKGAGFSSATDSLKALQDEHDYTQSLLESATFGLAALKAILDAQTSSLASLHAKVGASTDAAGTTTLFARLRQAIESYLADSTFGLAALDAELDSIIATLGLTADTGGTSTTGTVDAKLNAILSSVTPSRLDIRLG